MLWPLALGTALYSTDNKQVSAPSNSLLSSNFPLLRYSFVVLLVVVVFERVSFFQTKWDLYPLEKLQDSPSAAFFRATTVTSVQRQRFFHPNSAADTQNTQRQNVTPSS